MLVMGAEGSILRKLEATDCWLVLLGGLSSCMARLCSAAYTPQSFVPVEDKAGNSHAFPKPCNNPSQLLLLQDAFCHASAAHALTPAPAS